MTSARAQVADSRQFYSDDLSAYVVPTPAILPIRRTGYVRYGKRMLDIVLSLGGLALLWPVMLLIALLVRVKLGRGGIIFRQERIGLNGEPFTIYKFRSMLPERRSSSPAPYIGVERRQVHKSNDDPRHTPFGLKLRSSSLDELPQLINVLKGQMSLIGPRPELTWVAEAEGFSQHPRHLARPGITGSFQVSEYRSRNRIASGLHLDVAYVADVNLKSDLKILARTVLVLVPWLKS